MTPAVLRPTSGPVNRRTTDRTTRRVPTRAALLVALLWTWVALCERSFADTRVVAIGGAVTETIFALGAGDRIVATDSTSTFPAAAGALPKVGYVRTLSAEGVLALRPTLVLATAEAGPPATIAQLRAAAVAIVSVPTPHTIEGVRANVRTIARAMGIDERGDRLERRIAEQWAAVASDRGRTPAMPRVLFVLAHGGRNVMMGAGDGTAADAMIRLAGGRNALSGVQGYKPLAAEAVLAARPDVLLVTREGLEAAGGIEAILATHGLQLTPAGRAKRVVALDALYLLGFGPRTPDAVRDLVTAFASP